jgi:hypothetical protein
MHCSLLRFTVALNYALMFWKLLVLEILLGLSETETFLCSMTALLVKIVLLLVALQLLMLLVDIYGTKSMSLKHIL